MKNDLNSNHKDAHRSEKVVFVHGKDNSKLALYHFSNPTSEHDPVILTHGSFSNKTSCQPLAQFLQSRGFDCWVYEWVGHGASSYGDMRPNAEAFAMHDTPLVIEAVLHRTNKQQCVWLAHSGGGFMPLMYFARHPDQQRLLSAMVLIATQATHAGKSLKGKLRIAGVWLLGRLLGYVSGPVFGLGPERENKGFLDQWANWSWRGLWKGRDGFDYLHHFKNIHIKTMAISGGGDEIAPAAGCELILDALSSEEKKLLHCAKGTGFKEDYTHPRLVLSSSAKQEIWPQICDFLRR